MYHDLVYLLETKQAFVNRFLGLLCFSQGKPSNRSIEVITESMF